MTNKFNQRARYLRYTGVAFSMVVLLIVVSIAQFYFITSHAQGQPMLPSTDARPKWAQMISQWGEALLGKIEQHSHSNTYHEPPPKFAATREAMQTLAAKMREFAPAREQTVDENDVTELDVRTLSHGQVVPIRGNVRLVPANADLWQQNISFVITDSDTTLDCQGALMSSTDDTITAIVVRTLPDQSTGVHNVRIKNCLTLGYNHGLIIEQQTPANARYETLTAGKTTLAAQREQSPHDIWVDNLLVAHTRSSGIFIGDHVQRVDLYGIGVVKAGTVGLYFEFGSGHNTVSHSYFSQNGFRIGKPNREAIAIDSSVNNRIEYSHFDNNGAGGIFLYRNCFEHADDPSRSNHFLRTQGSDSNQIVHNVFANEPVSVWIAARQSRNLKGFACGAYTISETPFARYHLDEAERNQVLNNDFTSGKNAIIIEDDNNLVQGNCFASDLEQPIVIGSTIREQSSEGVVKNNRILDNRCANGARQPTIEFVGHSQAYTQTQ
ncbi:right-handed parallel beta-helix repeat-containing protein [Faucicola atlantae]|uniref:Right handed beta helix domain-containing protein n=1 Tax=Faucicola atlantae TaxID=34059 RepID=A0A1B8QL72_9GAMM|nr:right-handed parallel beta-helix repeat-containing protein [Moraxella atlantae]OBX84493.1 hypothetical protein A9306_03190 [Moraxella atlantae]